MSSELITALYADENGEIVNEQIVYELSPDIDDFLTLYNEYGGETTLYVKDYLARSNGKIKYREIKYKREEEYILKSDAIETFNNFTFEGSSSDNADEILEAISISQNDPEYIYYGGYANPNYQEKLAQAVADGVEKFFNSDT